MGLPRALRAHQQGDLDEAEAQYIRAIDQQKYDPIVFQNYGAILRNRGDLLKAKLIYQKGIKLFPGHRPLLKNACNLYAEMEDHISAFCVASCFLKVVLTDYHNNIDANRKTLDDIFTLMIRSLRSLESFNLALSISHLGLNTIGIYPQIALELYSLVTDIKASSTIDVPADLEQKLLLKINKLVVNDLQVEDQSKYFLALAQFQLIKRDGILALSSYEKAKSSLRRLPSSLQNTKTNLKSLQENFNVGSWNLGCGFLNSGDFTNGWPLFEYGLRAPAPGPQRWQRAIKKPFSANELPLWRGESLEASSLLLIEEQAIGDVMMFLSLLPRLVESVHSIGILLNDRLLPIYRRTFSEYGHPYDSIKIWSFDDVRKSNLTSALYDFQSPVGSICQHLGFPALSSGSPIPNQALQLQLSCSSKRDTLRNRYLTHNGHNVECLVGISWRGGGKGKRIQQKSLDRDTFLRFLPPIPGLRYVSLQYGDEVDDVKYWSSKGIDVICDQSVNPMKNMDLWLDQVGACDAVISVANTTIHGAGGLGIPTMCLLSQHFDWRWLKDVNNNISYWYNSVGIARQAISSTTPDHSWDSAVTSVNRWAKLAFPTPKSFSLH